MHTLLITYDLKRDKDYPELYSAIRKLNIYRNIQGSVWIVKTPHSAEAIIKHLGLYVDSDDSLFVAELFTEPWWRGLAESDTKWLESNLKFPS